MFTFFEFVIGTITNKFRSKITLCVPMEVRNKEITKLTGFLSVDIKIFDVFCDSLPDGLGRLLRQNKLNLIQVERLERWSIDSESFLFALKKLPVKPSLDRGNGLKVN